MTQLYNHKGFPITFDAGRAQFSATVVGKTLTAPSMDALKKKIDKVATFQEFEAYLEQVGWQAIAEKDGARRTLEGLFTGKRALVPCTVIGVEPDRRGRHNPPLWRVRYRYCKKSVEGTVRQVLPLTEAAVEAWVLLWTMQETCKADQHAMEQRHAGAVKVLHAAMPWQKAGEQ